MEEPGGLPSMESHRVGHDLSDLAAAADGTRCHDLSFWNLEFFFTFFHKLVSSAYLRLLIFLPAILIPACASFRTAFHMMYSAYKLNKQGDNKQP